MIRYRTEDFDNMGNLRAGKGLWCALLIQSHAWWLLALEMSVAGGDKGLLRVLYPENGSLAGGLLSGALVFMFLFVYPFRHNCPRLMVVSYVLLLLGSIYSVLRTGIILYGESGGTDESLWLSLMLLNIACVVELWPDRRNRDIYLPGDWRARCDSVSS